MVVTDEEGKDAVITNAQLVELKHALLGTCQLLGGALERLEIDASVEEAENRLLDGAMSVECCAGCAWWHESALMGRKSVMAQFAKSANRIYSSRSGKE